MPTLSSLLTPARRSLAGHLDRLCGALDHLSDQVREAIARAIGRAVAEAVREAIRAILAGPCPSQPPFPWALGRAAKTARPWAEADGSFWHHPSAYPDEPEEMLSHTTDLYSPADDDVDDCPSASDLPSQPGESPGRRALLAGCQAAAWWLKGHPGRFAVPVTVVIGLAAAVAALLKGPFILGGAGVAASVLGLLALADTARCGVAALTGATKP